MTRSHVSDPCLSLMSNFSVEYFGAAFNAFTGSLPSEFGSMTSLGEISSNFC